MFKNKFILKITTKIIITLIVIGFSAAVIYFFSKQINKLNSTMAEKKELDYLISNRDAVNNKIKTDFLRIDSGYQAKINEALPSVYNILSFVDSMDSLSKKYSLKQNLIFNEPTPETNISGPLNLMVITFNLTIEGANSDNFINYLKDFEKLPYFSSINSINYLGATTKGWQDNSTINISGSFYVQK